jgi:hypothetical protein
VVNWRAITAVAVLAGILASALMVVFVRTMTDNSLGATAATLTDFSHGVLGALTGIAIAAAISSALRPRSDALISAILGCTIGYLCLVFPVLAIPSGAVAATAGLMVAGLPFVVTAAALGSVVGFGAGTAVRRWRTPLDGSR